MVGSVLSNSCDIARIRMAMGSSLLSAAAALLAVGILILPTVHAQDNPRPSQARQSPAVGPPSPTTSPMAPGQSVQTTQPIPASVTQSVEQPIRVSEFTGFSTVRRLNRRFQFKIDPKTPVKELLPVAPTEPTANAWRRLLNLPAKPPRVVSTG